MLPEAFLSRMQGMLGSEYDAFIQSFEEEKYQALRLNTLKEGAESLSDGKNFAHLSPVPWAQNGYYYTSDDQPGKHPYHDAGVYYIQEPSAMAPVEFLKVEPGDRVLDLCAAPGGKSTQIAAKLKGDGFLVCNEIHPARAKILSENVERMGIRNACVTNMTPEGLAKLFPGYFNKILVDAPCSGEGMFRKNEAACDEWSPENVQLCADRQDEILDCAVSMLCPGGRMVYSTCTFAPAENEGSIARLLQRNPEMKIVAMEKEEKGLAGCDGVPEYVENGPEELRETLRIWPHKVQGEGHYGAVLQKTGEAADGYLGIPANGLEKGLLKSDPAVKAFLEFAGETLKENALCRLTEKNTKYIRFGENLYLASECMPGMKGMKVLRPGLHLGELKKNRFEPSHALALTLSPSDVLHHCGLLSSEATVMSYLNGQTFCREGDKGWYLISVDGFSLGWGKLAGGVMKNHYPKGLRK